MAELALGPALELAMLVLLAATLGACAVVYLRLRRFGEERRALAEAITRLEAASGRAEAAVAALRGKAEQLARGLAGHEQAARGQLRELDRLIEAAEVAGRRLQAQLRAAQAGAAEIALAQAPRARPIAAEAARPGREPPPAPGPRPESPAREDILEALRVLR